MSIPQLGFEIGMAVSDYNNGTVKTYDNIIKYTLLYIQEVKQGVAMKAISPDDLPDYYLLIGQAWASININDT